MRDWTGIGYASLPAPEHPDFQSRVREMFKRIDYYLRDSSAGFARIQNGQSPDGSGNPLGGQALDDYLYLPGRVGGQTVQSVDSSPTVTIDSLAHGLTSGGQLGTTAFRIANAGSALLDIKPYLLQASPDVLEAALVAGVNGAVNIPATDGTSGLRFTSTSNRAYVQAGVKSGTSVTNAALTLGGLGATVASRIATEGQYVSLSSTGSTGESGASVPIRTARIGINLDPFDYSGTAVASRPASLMVGDIRRSNSPTWPAATDAAPVIISNEGAVSGRRLLEIREVSAGTTPNQTLGAVGLALGAPLTAASTSDRNGRLLLFSAGSFRSSITSGVTASSGANSRITFLDQADAVTFQFERFSTWADTQATSVFEVPSRAMFVDTGGTALSRVALCATSTVIGNSALATMPAPATSRLLTLVRTSGVVVADISSTNDLATDIAGMSIYDRDAGDGYVLACRDSTGTVVAGFGAGNNAVAPYGILAYSFAIGDVAGGLYTTFSAGALSAARTVAIPDASGDMVLTSGVQTINSKTLSTSNSIRSSTASAGVAFVDNSTTTKALRMVLSGAVGNNSFTLSNTAARNYGFGNLSGNVVIVGDDPPAVASGALGKVDLTAQTTAIGSTALSNTPPAGLYSVQVYAACTTLSGSGSPTLDVTIGWTDVVGATTQNAVTALSLSATGRASGRVLCQVASGDITYSTTINSASGSPQYAVYIRVVSLG